MLSIEWGTQLLPVKRRLYIILKNRKHHIVVSYTARRTILDSQKFLKLLLGLRSDTQLSFFLFAWMAPKQQTLAGGFSYCLLNSQCKSETITCWATFLGFYSEISQREYLDAFHNDERRIFGVEIDLRSGGVCSDTHTFIMPATD